MADQRLGSPTALRSIHAELAVLNSFNTGAVNARASAVWNAVSKIMFMPVPCPGPFTVMKFACENGAAVSGNLDMGLYTPEGQLIVSTGSTAQSGTSGWQVIDVTDTAVPPGWYYLAMVLDNVTGTNDRLGSLAALKRMYGCREQLSTFPLPTSATFAVVTDAYIPSFMAMGVVTI
jgi:hypothetical protein